MDTDVRGLRRWTQIDAEEISEVRKARLHPPKRVFVQAGRFGSRVGELDPWLSDLAVTPFFRKIYSPLQTRWASGLGGLMTEP
jgi:hypothetical protein